MSTLFSTFLGGSSTLNSGLNSGGGAVTVPTFNSFSTTSTSSLGTTGTLFGSSSGTSFGNSLLFGSTFGGTTLSGTGFGTTTGSTFTTSTGFPTGNYGPQGDDILVIGTEDTAGSIPATSFVLTDGTLANFVIVSTVPANGTLTFGSNLSVSAGQYLTATELATLTYTPDPMFFGNDPFTVSMSVDGSTYDSTPSTVTMSIAGTPNDPVITVQPAVTIVDQTTDSTSIGAAILASFSDPDGDTLASVLLTAPTAAVGAMAYTNSAGAIIPITAGTQATLNLAELATVSLEVPDISSSGTASLSYSVTDSTGATTGGGELTINLEEGNDAPTFGAVASVSIDENDSSTTVTPVTATDPDAGDSFTYSLGGADMAFFSIDANSGAINFSAPQDHEAMSDADGNNRFEVDVIATDVAGASETQAVTIRLNDVENENAPVFTSGAVGSVTESAVNGTVVYTPAVTDADTPAGTITYGLSGADSGSFTIDTTTGVTTVNATPLDFEMPSDADGDNVYEITLTATDTSADGSVLTTTQDVSITVTDVNDSAPVMVGGSTSTTATTSVSVAENSTVAFTASATDADAGDTLTYHIVSGSGADRALFEIDEATGVVSFIDAPDMEAPTDTGADNNYRVLVEAEDAAGIRSMPLRYSVDVTDLDDEAPAPAPVSSSNTVLAAAVAAVAGAVGGASHNIAAGSLSFSINETAGADLVALDLEFGDGEDQAVADDGVTYSMTSTKTQTGFEIDPDTGEISTIAGLDFESGATEILTVTITDDSALAQTAMTDVTVTIQDRNDAPVLMDGTLNADEGLVKYLGTVEDFANSFGFTDEDGDGVGSITLTADPIYGELHSGTSSTYGPSSLLSIASSATAIQHLFYVADADFNSALDPNGLTMSPVETFSFTATDDGSNPETSEEVTATVTVSPIADAPSVNASYGSETAEEPWSDSGELDVDSFVTVDSIANGPAQSLASLTVEDVDYLNSLDFVAADTDFNVSIVQISNTSQIATVGGAMADGIEDQDFVVTNGVLFFEDINANSGAFMNAAYDGAISLAITVNDSTGLTSDPWYVIVDFDATL